MHEYILLEAGGTDDTYSFMTHIQKLGGRDLNPPSESLIRAQGKRKYIFSNNSKRIFIIRNLQTNDLLENKEILLHLKKIENLMPKWIYLSGHTGTFGYSGLMNKLPEGQGHAHYTFREGKFYLTDDGPKKFWKEINTKATGRKCVAVIMMGCNVIPNRRHMKNLQNAFGAVKSPVILGWYDKCPTQAYLKDAVLKSFFERVKKNLENKDVTFQDQDLIVELWGQVGTKIHPNIGAFDTDGKVWMVKKEKWVKVD
jgi:hypothetical protein